MLDVEEGGYVENERESPPRIPNGHRAWAFQWLAFRWLASSICWLSVYCFKIAVDAYAAFAYCKSNDRSFCALSALCIATPTLAFTIYLISLHIKREGNITIRAFGCKTLCGGLLLIPRQTIRRRPPSEEEKHECSSLQKKAVILGFFEEFIAGSIQLSLQTYIYLTYLYYDETIYASNEGWTTVLYLEFAASGLVLFSMLMALLRKDDGPLTCRLSCFGWILMIASRVVTIALLAFVIRQPILLPTWIVLHAIVVTVWMLCDRNIFPYEELSTPNRCATGVLIVLLFGLPSFIFWPMIHGPKAKKHTCLFISLTTAENIFFCVASLGIKISISSYWIWLGITVGLNLVGCCFVFAYIRLKPRRRHENEALHGIYRDIYGDTFQMNV